MRFCCKTSNFHVDIGLPLALLSVLFAFFVGCVCGGSVDGGINFISYYFFWQSLGVIYYGF
jgi:hypothetical protein